jgi:hypothetical protein
LLFPLPLAIAVAVAVDHCMVDSDSVALPTAVTVAVTLAVGHCRLCHRRPLQLPSPWPSPLPLPLAISESCCLGMARIVFKQFEERMLTLFYFVQTVGGALNKAR